MSFRHLHVQGALPTTAVETPCVNICVIDDDGLCVGCARTLEEIGSWSRWSAAKRSAVMLTLPGRRTPPSA